MPGQREGKTINIALFFNDSCHDGISVPRVGLLVVEVDRDADLQWGAGKMVKVIACLLASKLKKLSALA